MISNVTSDSLVVQGYASSPSADAVIGTITVPAGRYHIAYTIWTNGATSITMKIGDLTLAHNNLNQSAGSPFLYVELIKTFSVSATIRATAGTVQNGPGAVVHNVLIVATRT